MSDSKSTLLAFLADYEKVTPGYTQDGGIPDVFFMGRVYVNDHINSASIEIRPSYATSMFGIPPVIACGMLPEHLEYFSHWLINDSVRYEISFSAVPIFPVDEGKFLIHIKPPTDG